MLLPSLCVSGEAVLASFPEKKQGRRWPRSAEDRLGPGPSCTLRLKVTPQSCGFRDPLTSTQGHMCSKSQVSGGRVPRLTERIGPWEQGLVQRTQLSSCAACPNLSSPIPPSCTTLCWSRFCLRALLRRPVLEGGLGVGGGPENRAGGGGTGLVPALSSLQPPTLSREERGSPHG